MNPEEWLVDPATKKVHGGAHYPLVVYTRNSKARSEAAMKKLKETRPYNTQKWAQGALAAKQTHNRSTVAQDTATIEPAYISQSAPDGGAAEVWFPQDGSHAGGPQLRRGTDHASQMDAVVQAVQEIGSKVEDIHAQWKEDSWSQCDGQQWGEDSWSQWDGQQWDDYSWSQWEGQQEWSQSQRDRHRPPLRRKKECGGNWNQRWSP